MLKVVVEISDAQIRNCAYDVVERLIIDECDWSADAVELSGLEIKELVRDLAAYPVFHQALIKMVRECGVLALDYDFLERFDNSGGLDVIEKLFFKEVYPVINMMDRIIREAEQPEDSCEEAIAVLKKAGYKVVRA